MSSPRSCCILTISSTLAQGKTLVERVAGPSKGVAPPTIDTATETTLNIPWTISNKYYTADVHFSVAETRHVKGEDATDIPACIYVFSIAEPFKQEFCSIVTYLKQYDFDVSLAVSMPAGQSPVEVEQDGLEEFFDEHGFEYVNGSLHVPQKHDVDMEGIPGIGRVVDALSTIMWPSMIQKEGSRRAKSRSVVSIPGAADEEDGFRALLSADKDASMNSTLQREKDALEKWLEEGADDEKDPWEGQNFSPQSPEHSNPLTSQSSVPGFDDNFSDFVSAPASINTGVIDGDPSLPSREEIDATSRKLFGMASVNDLDEGDSQAPFDLSRVLGSLEAMKEEIAGITDEDEKRKAAARVALSLVYGLEER